MSRAILSAIARLLRFGVVVQPIVFVVCAFCASGQSLAQDKFVPPPYVPPPRTVEDILAVLDQFKPDPARVNDLREKVSKSPPNTTDKADLYKFYWERALVARELGMGPQSLADLRKAVELASPNDPEIYYTYSGLALAEQNGGNYATSIKLLREVPKFAMLGGQAVGAWSEIASMYAQIGELAAARDALDRAQSILSNQLSTSRAAGFLGNNWRSFVEVARGDVLRGEGKYGQAETAYRQVLVLKDRQFEIQSAGLRGFSGYAPPINSVVVRAVRAEAVNLGAALIEQGKYAEAELAARNALKRALSYFGKYSPPAGSALGRLALYIFEQGRFGDASALARAVVDIYQTIGAPPNAISLVDAQRIIGAALVEDGKYSEAEAIFRTVRDALLKDPETAELLGTGTVDSVYAQIRLGKTADAVEQARGIYELQKKRTGDAFYGALEARGFYALALAADRRNEDALREYRACIPGLLAAAGERSGEQGVGRTLRLNRILEGYLTVLANFAASGQSPASGIDAVDESFRIADVVRGSYVQRALSASAARASISDPKLAALAREEQDNQQRIGVLTAFLPQLLAAPPDQQLPKIIADMTKDIASLRANRAKLKAEIEQRFPDYANLIDPKPPTLEQARSALRDGEALISIYVGADKTYLWAIPKQGAPAFAVAPQGEKDVARAVAELRKAFELSDASIARFPKYDVGAAYKLYSALLAPVEAGWKGAANLLIVPHRALGQLPFGVLVTAQAATPGESGTPFAGYKQVPWLLRKAAITQLPSVNALIALRAVPQPGGERRAFIGFGDPYFSKEQQAQAGAQGSTQVAMLARGVALRNLAISKVAYSPPAAPGGAQASAELRNAPAVSNSSSLAQLARLPETADEINEIAKALKADMASDVFLGAKANEKTVKTVDLSNRRVIAFATHGLVPGDLNGLEQPALALSAPDVAGIDGDGLLAMDEILGLKLNADWVVLSACNTAAAGGAGAEAVSGLGRAFFYAGARALLVSNWPVETLSARLLTTDLFKRQSENPKLTRAEALQQTMLGLMDGQGQTDAAGAMQFSYAHPMFWAPFSLVGDGAGR